MYHHIKKELYLKVEVEQKIFNKALQNKMGEICVPNTPEWQDKIKLENKFIRLTTNGSYIDLKIQRISVKGDIIIRLGDIIDFDRQKMHTYTNTKTGEQCQATTVQGASDIFKVNLRHIKKAK